MQTVATSKSRSQIDTDVASIQVPLLTAQANFLVKRSHEVDTGMRTNITITLTAVV